jgi:branched-chain amino acid transport system ATP-binding protein
VHTLVVSPDADDRGAQRSLRRQPYTARRRSCAVKGEDRCHAWPQRGWQDDDRPDSDGLVPPTGGHVLLEGVEITGWAAHRIARAGVAYVPEGRQIFPDLNVVENIRVGERRPARIWPIDRLFELFPALRERAGSKGAQLSGGEQQMLAIARALVSDPNVLLLDEPSQGLAPLVVCELAQVIRELRSDGVAILLIEQNVRLAEEVADEINVMVKGRIVYAATPMQYRSEEDAIRRRFLTV